MRKRRILNFHRPRPSRSRHDSRLSSPCVLVRRYPASNARRRYHEFFVLRIIPRKRSGRPGACHHRFRHLRVSLRRLRPRSPSGKGLAKWLMQCVFPKSGIALRRTLPPHQIPSRRGWNLRLSHSLRLSVLVLQRVRVYSLRVLSFRPSLADCSAAFLESMRPYLRRI
jgi:hypothetical protein